MPPLPMPKEPPCRDWGMDQSERNPLQNEDKVQYMLLLWWWKTENYGKGLPNIVMYVQVIFKKEFIWDNSGQSLPLAGWHQYKNF